MRRLNCSLLAAAVALGTVWAAATTPESAAFAAETGRVGYVDTPKLPNSPWRVHDRDRPQPRKVQPGDSGSAALPQKAPADAIVLFDGKDLSQWVCKNPKAVDDGFANVAKTGQLQSKREFGDCQLHVEWATPAKADGGNMTWGNSGVLMMGRFEIQILESHDSYIYADGNAGAIYGQYPPLVNPARKPGQWQSFDIVFEAPRFRDGKLAKPAYCTVFFNGVLVQNRKEVLGEMAHRVLPKYTSTSETGPVVLQEHGSAVRFRNVWIRPLTLDP